MTTHVPWVLLSVGLCVVLCSACGEKEPPKAARQPTPLDLSTAATISGQLRFAGAVPEQTVLQLGGWSECAAQHPGGRPYAGDIRVNDGQLPNAVGYVTEGLGDHAFRVP